MNTEMNRRSFVKGALLSSASIALALDASGQAESKAPLAQTASQATLPKGKIGKLEISRLILGGNLLTHYTHSRDLQYVYTLAAHYNTDEKILETLALAEANGINTVSMHNPKHPMSLLRRYRRERGGKIQWIICPTAPIEPDMAQYSREVDELVRDGSESVYVWGVHSDALVAQGRMDLIAKAVKTIKARGVPCGVGAHSIEVIEKCEQEGVEADFYIKTYHHHNYPTGPKPEELNAPYSEFPGYWCREPDATAELMKKVEKPWIAFKTMAAGAIPPRDAIPYVFSNGADFVLAGMFDFEIAEDVQIARDALSGISKRARPWRA